MSIYTNIEDFTSSLSDLEAAFDSLKREWDSHLSSDVDDLISERDTLLDRVAELEKELDELKGAPDA